MKPTFEPKNARNERTTDRSFPVTDFNYHAIALENYNGRCAKPTVPSFRNISRQYFSSEARHDFVGEGLFFVAIVVTVAVPMVNGARVVIAFAQTMGLL